jgi:RNA recognition motif-containing protein
LNDRALYNDFYAVGYLKQVEVDKTAGIGYLQFDTEEDAQNAVRKNDGMRIEGARVKVELIPDRALNVPNLLVPLVVADKEERRERRGWREDEAEG